MPIIPKSEQGYLQDSAHYARERSIDPNFGMGTVHALRQLAGAMRQAGDEYNRYLARLQDSEDEMNLQKMQTMMYISEKDAEKQRTENPADYANFENNEAQRVTQLYNKDLKPYYDKLSNRAKEQFDGVIYPRYQQNGYDKAFSVANQARVSVGQQQSLDSVNTYLNTGAYDLARDAVNRATSAGYFSPETKEKLTSKINHTETKQGYDSELNAMSPLDAIKALDAQDTDGKKYNFTDYTEDERNQARRRVLDKARENTAKWNAKIASDTENGKCMTAEDIASMASDCALDVSDPIMKRTVQQMKKNESANSLNAIISEQDVIAAQIASGDMARASEQLTPKGIDRYEAQGIINHEDANKLRVKCYQIQKAQEIEAERKANKAEAQESKTRAQNGRDTASGVSYNIITGRIKTPEQCEKVRNEIMRLTDAGTLDKGYAVSILNNLDSVENRYKQATQNNQANAIFADACKSENLQRDMPQFEKRIAQLYGLGTSEYQSAMNRLNGMITQTTYKKDNPVYEAAIADFDDTTWEHSGWLWNDFSTEQTNLLRINLENAFKSGRIKSMEDYQQWKQQILEYAETLKSKQATQWLLNGLLMPQQEASPEIYNETWQGVKPKENETKPEGFLDIFGRMATPAK